MKALNILGILLVSSPFIVIYVFGGYTIGFLEISILFLSVPALLAAVVLGCYLIDY